MKKACFIIAVLLFFALDSAALPKWLAMSVSIGNVRLGPGKKYDMIWQAEKYYPFKVLEKKGVWYRVRDFEGDEGWVNKKIVADIPTVITIKDKCNVRDGPGTRFDKLGVVDKGIPFKVLKREGPWINVKHEDGDVGWIYETLVWPRAGKK